MVEVVAMRSSSLLSEVLFAESVYERGRWIHKNLANSSIALEQQYLLFVGDNGEKHVDPNRIRREVYEFFFLLL